MSCRGFGPSFPGNHRREQGRQKQYHDSRRADTSSCVLRVWPPPSPSIVLLRAVICSAARGVHGLRAARAVSSAAVRRVPRSSLRGSFGININVNSLLPTPAQSLVGTRAASILVVVAAAAFAIIITCHVRLAAE